MSLTVDESYALTLHQGESSALVLEYFKDKAETIPEDFTGWTFELKATKAFKSPAALTLTQPANIAVDGGKVRIEFHKSTTASMPVGEYLYQLTRTDGGNQLKFMLDSTLTILGAVK